MESRNKLKFWRFCEKLFMASYYLIFLGGSVLILLLLTELFLWKVWSPIQHSASIHATHGAQEAYSSRLEQIELSREQQVATLGMGKYEPYIVWRRPSFAGKYINIDADGVRKTVNPDCTPRLKIHIYGGSTVWGSGVPDSLTIPSFLSQIAAQDSPQCVHIENYGEGGYVTSQDLNRFICNLRANNAPNIAIFYGGVNDAYVSYQGLPAGSPQFLPVLRERLDSLNNGRKMLFIRLLKATYTYKTIRELAAGLARPESSSFEQSSNINDAVNVFLWNYRFALKLGKIQGVKVLLVLQPSLLVSGKELTDEEKTILARRISPRTRETFLAFYSKVMNAIRSSEIVDLSKLFDHETGTIFIDSWHLSARGNRCVADRLYKLLTERAWLNSQARDKKRIQEPLPPHRKYSN